MDDCQLPACNAGHRYCLDGLTQDVLREMNERHVAIGHFPIRAAVLGDLLSRINKKQLTTKSAREVFAALLAEGHERAVISSHHIDQIIAEKGLALVTDTGEVEKAIDEVLAKNPKIAADFKGGKQGAIGPLIGQVMKQVKGADPQAVREMIVNKLQG